MRKLNIILVLFAFSLLAISCGDQNNTTDGKSKGETNKAEEKTKESKTIGAVYTASNKTDENTLYAFAQKENGELAPIGEYGTKGKGTGNVEIFEGSKNDPTHPLADGVDPLISAYGVYKANNNKNIIVVNAGSSDVSSMKVNDDHSLTFVNSVKAGDKYPLSVASHEKKVYVASAGTKTMPPFSGNITGYSIDGDGKLTPIEGSTRDLGARPACIAFTSDGKFLIITELVTGMIKVFGVNDDGNISEKPVSIVSSPHDAKKDRWLPIPVGFDIVKKSNGYVVLVSEARFLNNKGELRKEKDKVPQSPLYSWQTGSTSSYFVDNEGKINLVSGDVMTGKEMEGGQIANCWVEASNDGKTLYAANALSSSISTYSIADDGKIELKNETAFKDDSKKLFFSDLYFNKNGKYLYQLIGNQGKIMSIKVSEDGKLESVGTYGDMPAIGTYGLIAL